MKKFVVMNEYLSRNNDWIYILDALVNLITRIFSKIVIQINILAHSIIIFYINGIALSSILSILYKMRRYFSSKEKKISIDS